MSPTQAYLSLHFCVLLWGFTAILGKIISLPAVALVFWRMAIASLSLLLLPRVWRGLRTLSLARFAAMVGVGLLITLHWLTFYGAVKVASASLAVLCMTLAPVFAVLLAPMLLRTTLSLRDLLLSAMVLPGMLLVLGTPGGQHPLGLLLGVVSALFVALFSNLNKHLVMKEGALTVSAVELSTGAVALALLLPVLPAQAFWPTAADWPWLLVFALACTTLPFVLANLVLRRLSPFATQFAVNLEPIYALLLAAWWLDEARHVGSPFYLGATLVLLPVLAQPFLRRPAG